MVLLTWLATVQAQQAGWYVLETDTHRIVYPQEAAAWTEDLAQRLPAIRRAVEEEVGNPAKGKTQVLVRDPYSFPSGEAFPLGTAPRIELWASAPTADGELGFYNRWSDVLVAHEDAHIVHLTRRSRNVSGQLMQQLFGIGPLLRKVPPWVSEGYATLLEGRVAGSGRPAGAYRATILRRMAQRGKLPTLGQLNGRWRYLVASAFLEWLDDREGGKSLQKVWARLAARERRTYTGAFRGVYGASLTDLYARWTAELTADSMAADGAEWQRPTQWARLRGPARGMTVSPDGKKLAVVRRSADGVSELVVVETASDTAAIERREKLADLQFLLDDEDVPNKPLRLAPHRVVHTFRTRTHAPSNPRWIDDDRILYDAPTIDGDGRVRRDLYIRDITRNRTRRVTRHADLRRATPGPDNTAWGVVSRFGTTALATIDLSSGEVILRTEPSVAIVVDQPRPHPDGTTVAWLENHGAGFAAVVRRGQNAPVALPLPAGGSVTGIAWQDDHLIASVALDGRFDLWELGPDQPVRLTDTGGALAPEPSELGIFHLELEFDRHDVHLLPHDGPRHPAAGTASGLAAPAPLPERELSTSAPTVRPMGLGPLQVRVLGSGMVGRGGSTTELGVRLGDLAGRNEFMFALAGGDANGRSGLGGWWTNRTSPLEPTVRAWALQGARETPMWFGGSVALTAESGSSTTTTSAEGGAWVEGSRAGVRSAVFGEVAAGVLEPRSRAVWAWAAAMGSAGVERAAHAQGHAAGGLTLGRRWELVLGAAVTARAGGDLTLGGVTNGLQPDAAQWTRHRVGWALPNSATGPVLTEIDIAAGVDGVYLGLESVQIDGQTFSYFGLLLDTVKDAEPMFGVPGLTMQAGLGCAVQKGRGIDDDVCRKLSDLRTWTQLTWQP